MPTKSKKQKTEEKTEREYTIPLRKKYQHVPRYKKTPKAVKTIKEFLARHMKIYDRDLKKIKLDKYLNEFVWFRGIKKPPAKIKIKAVKEKDKEGNEIVRVELAELPEKLKFKKLREEKREKASEETAKKKKSLMEKAREGMEKKPEEKAEQTEEQKKEEAEKAKAGEEATKQLEKAQAKQLKRQVSAKTKQPKRQQRVALKK